MIFPSFVVMGAEFRSTEPKRYLTCVTEGSQQGFLELNPTSQVPSLKAKFVLENDGQFVHIRCCYNNKYWTRKDVSSVCYIVAAASEPVKDRCAANCTLFKPEKSGSGLRFIHVQTGYEVYRLWLRDSACFLYMTDRTGIEFDVIDFGILVRLPKRVIFKGDNGNYLRVQRYNETTIIHADAAQHNQNLRPSNNAYNEFSASDKADPTALYEIIHLNGSILIKSIHNGKLLRCNKSGDNNWIFADSDNSTSESLDTLFEVIQIKESGNNVIALRSRGNNKICKRNDPGFFGSRKNCLDASASTTLNQTFLVVEEPVITRKIEFEYHLQEAIIIGRMPVQNSTVTIPNMSKKGATFSHKFQYDEIKRSTWNTTTTLTSHVKAEITYKIPKFEGGKFEVGSESSSTQHMEKSSDSSVKSETQCNFYVPAMSKAIIEWYVEQITYEIPFSCIQTDIYNDGKVETIRPKDGVYHGIQAHEIKYKQINKTISS